MNTTRLPAPRRCAKWVCCVLALLLPLAGCLPLRGAGEKRTAMGPEPPTNAYYHYLAAQLWQQEGARDKALAEMSAAYRLDTQTPLLGRELAVLLVQSDDNASALKVTEETLAAHPGDISTLIIYGRIQQELKNTTAAAEAFEKVLAVDPNQQSIYLHLGGLYLDSGDRAAAKAVFERLVNRFNDSYVGYFYLGRIAAADGDDDTAEKLFLKTLSIKGDLDEPRFELVEINQRRGRTDKAIALYREVLAQDPENLRAALGLGVLYHTAGKQGESRRLLADVGRRYGADNRLARTIAGQYVDRKAFDAARVILEGVLAVQPANPELLYLTGLTFEGLDDWASAVANFQRVPVSSRLYRDAAIHIAFIYQEQGKIDAAIDTLKAVLPDVDDNAEFYFYLGSLYEEKGAFEEAAQWLVQGLDKTPEDAKLHFRLGVVYDKQGNKDASINQMQKTIALDPEHASALNYLGYTYADLGVKLDEAEALIKRALSIKPDDGYITDSLGWVYFKKGQIAEALEWLKKASLLAPEDPVIMEHLGDAYQRLGDTAQAARYYRQALEKKTEDKEPLAEKLKVLEGAGKP